jgi:ABC-type glutathione transport system ATPase component
MKKYNYIVITLIILTVLNACKKEESVPNADTSLPGTLNVEFVNKISDRVYVLNSGEVIASGPFEKVRQDPAVVAAYLGTSTPADIKLGSGN